MVSVLKQMMDCNITGKKPIVEALKVKYKRFLAVMLITFSASFNVYAKSYPIRYDTNIIGESTVVEAREGQTLNDIGLANEIGALQIAQANPDINPLKKLHAGRVVNIPSRYILPDTKRDGIVINLAEMRLYYYPKGKDEVLTVPVGIGREGKWKTPLGKTRVIKKEEDPIWHPTQNVRVEALMHGTPIPYAFPPGPKNPLGKYILRLSWPTYLIHGTNHTGGVGARVSAGCIRLQPKTIKKLYDQVAVGTSVLVIDEPYKIGFKNNTIYLEAHKPLRDSGYRQKKEFSDLVLKFYRTFSGEKKPYPQWSKIKQLLKKAEGLPKACGYLKDKS